MQLGLPLALIVWLAVWPLRGRARWVHGVAVLCVVGLIGLVGQWGWPTAYAPYALVGLALLGLLLGRRRAVGRGDPPVWPGGILAVLVAGAACAAIGLILQGRLRPLEVVALDMPLDRKSVV